MNIIPGYIFNILGVDTHLTSFGEEFCTFADVPEGHSGTINHRVDRHASKPVANHQKQGVARFVRRPQPPWFG